MLILTKAAVDDILKCAAQAATGAVAGPFNGAEIALATAGPAPTSEVTLADYTECTFAGYVRKPLGTPGAAYDATGREKTVYPSLQWNPTDATKPETVTFILWVSAATGGTLLGVTQLPNPAPMANNEDGLVFVPEFGLMLTWDYADGTVI